MAGEETVIRKICDHINRWEGAPCFFVPESREGENGYFGPDRSARGTVTAAKGPVRVRSYIDGSYAGQYAFEVRCQIGSGDPAEAAALLGRFDALTVYLEQFVPPAGEGRIYGRCRAAAQASGGDAGQDGRTEYRASFTVEYRQASGENRN